MKSETETQVKTGPAAQRASGRSRAAAGEVADRPRSERSLSPVDRRVPDRSKPNWSQDRLSPRTGGLSSVDLAAGASIDIPISTTGLTLTSGAEGFSGGASRGGSTGSAARSPSFGASAGTFHRSVAQARRATRQTPRPTRPRQRASRRHPLGQTTPDRFGPGIEFAIAHHLADASASRMPKEKPGKHGANARWPGQNCLARIAGWSGIARPPAKSSQPKPVSRACMRHHTRRRSPEPAVRPPGRLPRTRRAA